METTTQGSGKMPKYNDDLFELIFSRPRDEVRQRYGSIRPENNAVGYLRNAERILIRDIAEVDPLVAMLAARWGEFRRHAAAWALNRVMPEMLPALIEDEVVPPKLGATLLDHLRGVMADEAAGHDEGSLKQEADEIQKAAKDAQKELEKAGKQVGHDVLDKALHGDPAEGSWRPPTLDDPELPVRPPLTWYIPQGKGNGDDFRRRFVHHGSTFFIKWTSVEWTELLLGPLNPPDKKLHYSGDRYPLTCHTRHSSFGDNPALLEVPGGLVQSKGSILTDHHWVDWHWYQRIHHWQDGPMSLGYRNPTPGEPPAGQWRFIPKGVNISMYTAALSIPGAFDLDWEKLRDRLEKITTKGVDAAIGLLQNALKGTAVDVPMIGSVSLGFIGNALSGVTDQAEALAKEAIDWLVLQLREGKFPVVTVQHKTIGGPRGEPLQSIVTYHVRTSTEKGAIDAAGETGNTLWIDDFSGPTAPQPGQAPVFAAGDTSVTWSWLSKVPSRAMHHRSLDDVAGGGHLYQWAPSKYGAHVYVPLRELNDALKPAGDGIYAVALRSETVKIDVEFESDGE